MKDGEIRHKLSPAQVSVMLHRVTEPPYFGKYWDTFSDGMYVCAACDTPLFSSVEKFDSKTGWPSFKKPVSDRDLQFKSEPGPDDKVEVRCKKCKSHLGYVIPGDMPYYRINSVCMTFLPAVVAGAGTPPESVRPIVETPAESIASSPWSIQSIAVGVIIGAMIGAGLMWYVQPIPQTASPVATSTIETATTTTEEPEPDTSTVQDVSSPVETPVSEPETVKETPISSENPATST
jgi:peptide-methionine (R)-S-oxide reductase